MRKAQLIIVLGTNGTGKTTFLKNRIKNINYTNRKLIVTPDPMEWTDYDTIKISELKTFTGIKRIIYFDGLIQTLAAQLVNCVIVFDDFKAFLITKQVELNAIRNLCIRRRQKMLDIFIAGHGFTEITPSFLFTFMSKIVLFKTNDSIVRVKNRIKNFEAVQKAQLNANNRADFKPIIINLE